MVFVRRFLPPISCLCSFEAAARQASFTAAAQELNLTQSAISRHIRILEERLGTALFIRDRQTVKLTRAGKIYALEIRSALSIIFEATLGLRACPRGEALNIGIEATLGARWLLPALKGFYAEHPNLDVNLVSDLDQKTIDIFIRPLIDEENNLTGLPLIDSNIIPVCAPSLLANQPVENVEEMLKMPLLHLTTRPDLWERWFESQSVTPSAVNGTLFDQYTTLISATLAGFGLALLPKILIQQELTSGALTCLPHKEGTFTKTYYLLYRKTDEKLALIKHFTDYIFHFAACSSESQKQSIKQAPR